MFIWRKFHSFGHMFRNCDPHKMILFAGQLEEICLKNVIDEQENREQSATSEVVMRSDNCG